MKNIKLGIVILLLTLSSTLWGSTTENVTVDISFDSLTLFIMIVLGSLVGSYFLKDEFSSM